jgi:hypothetical protein
MLRLFLVMALALALPRAVMASEKPEMTMYRVPFCGCCDGHAEHLRANGYRVNVVESRNMTAIKRKFSVPQEFEGCHTIEVGGYVVEGHVPANVVDRLLRERPAIRGISLPGMPEGSPGMTGDKKEPFVIYELSNERGKVFATE